jgi:chloramphenicol 3-O-phosphotransferase
LSSAKQEAARSLTLRRLSMLESVLPQSQRPLPLPRNAGTDVLRERYLAHVHSLSDTVPQFDRLLFTLTGAC